MSRESRAGPEKRDNQDLPIVREVIPEEPMLSHPLFHLLLTEGVGEIPQHILNQSDSIEYGAL